MLYTFKEKIKNSVKKKGAKRQNRFLMDIYGIQCLYGTIFYNSEVNRAGKIISGCLKDLFKMRRFMYKFINLREHVTSIQRVFR